MFNIFRLETMWASHLYFINIINNSWEEEKEIMQAIPNFQINAIEWNKKVFGNIFYKKRNSLKG